MKKNIIFILSVLLLLGAASFILSACGNDEEPESGFTVTFNAGYDGGSNYTKKIVRNETFGELSKYLGEQRNENYWFVGWMYTDIDSKFIQPDTKFVWEHDISLTAIWYDATFYNAFLSTINADNYAIVNHLNEAAVYKDGELSEGYSYRNGGLWYDEGDVYFTENIEGLKNLHISNYNFELGSIYEPISVESDYALYYWITDEEFMTLKENLQQDYLEYTFEKTNNGFRYSNYTFEIENGYITNIKIGLSEYRLYFGDIPDGLIPTRNKTYLPAYSLYFSQTDDAANDILIWTVGSSELFNVGRTDHYFPTGYNIKFSDLQNHISIGYYCINEERYFPTRYDITTYYYDKNGRNEITRDFKLNSNITVYAKGAIDLSKLDNAVTAELGENNFTAPQTSIGYDTTFVVSFTATETKEYLFTLETARNSSSYPPLSYSEKTIIVNSAGYQLAWEVYSNTAVTELSAQLTSGETYYLMHYIHCDGENADVKVIVT